FLFGRKLPFSTTHHPGQLLLQLSPLYSTLSLLSSSLSLFLSHSRYSLPSTLPLLPSPPHSHTHTLSITYFYYLSLPLVSISSVALIPSEPTLVFTLCLLHCLE